MLTIIQTLLTTWKNKQSPCYYFSWSFGILRTFGLGMTIVIWGQICNHGWDENIHLKYPKFLTPCFHPKAPHSLKHQVGRRFWFKPSNANLVDMIFLPYPLPPSPYSKQWLVVNFPAINPAPNFAPSRLLAARSSLNPPVSQCYRKGSWLSNQLPSWITLSSLPSLSGKALGQTLFPRCR